MKDGDRLPEDLSILARRGELSPAEMRRFDVYSSASPVTAWLHRLGGEYDAASTAEPGDEALLERVIEKACERRASARAPRLHLRRSTLVVAVLACSASAALAAAGVLHWTRGVVVPNVTQPAKHGAPGPSGLANSRPETPRPMASTGPATLESDAATTRRGPDVRAESASDRRGASAEHQSAADLFSLANELRKAGRTNEAIAAYRKLQKEHPAAQETSVSHVLLARILMRHEGPAAAEEQFARYLARHPRGSLAEEALSGSAAAYRALGRNEDERRVLEMLLSRFPSSIYAGAARERLDELD